LLGFIKLRVDGFVLKKLTLQTANHLGIEVYILQMSSDGIKVIFPLVKPKIGENNCKSKHQKYGKIKQQF
jgi:hypothetical protein